MSAFSNWQLSILPGRFTERYAIHGAFGTRAIQARRSQVLSTYMGLSSETEALIPIESLTQKS